MENIKTPKIIYEDELVLVIDKPAGLIVHADGKREQETLADWILLNRPEIKDVGEKMIIKKGEEEIVIERPGIMHRLDKETSGVMVIAKTDAMFKFLKRQFFEHTIKKTYRAFIYGHMTHDIGMIDAPIGRSSTDIRMWNAGRGARGEKREAKTRYRVLARFVDPETNEKVSEIEAYPQTGRTHQIRVHFKFVNHPIVSDFLYSQNKPKLLGFERVALHALSLDFAFPGGERKTFTAEPPEDFKNAETIAKALKM